MTTVQPVPVRAELRVIFKDGRETLESVMLNGDLSVASEVRALGERVDNLIAQPPVVVVLSDEQVDQLEVALRDPDYVDRMLADARASGMVEIDNPLRPEVRPRRGRDD